MLKTIDHLWNGPKTSEWTVILAHGAGAPMDSPFMETFAEGLSSRGRRVLRFSFPYMAEQQRTGKRRPPNRIPVLQETWRTVVSACGAPNRLVIGGKSMGGRAASTVADSLAVGGLVCLGYPFHPPGRPENTRTEHLADIRTPTLIVQGERDALGNAPTVATYTLSATINIHWIPDGDHSFKPRKVSGHTQDGNWQMGIEAVDRFIDSLR